jgi:hypothetical protein
MGMMEDTVVVMMFVTAKRYETEIFDIADFRVVSKVVLGLISEEDMMRLNTYKSPQLPASEMRSDQALV